MLIVICILTFAPKNVNAWSWDWTYPFYDQEILKQILNSLTQMVQQIPCNIMQFSLTSPFWEEISYDPK